MFCDTEGAWVFKVAPEKSQTAHKMNSVHLIVNCFIAQLLKCSHTQCKALKNTISVISDMILSAFGLIFLFLFLNKIQYMTDRPSL